LVNEGSSQLSPPLHIYRDKHTIIILVINTYNHLWDRSRPTIVEMEREIKRKKSKIFISTEIEALVESLFLEEAQDA
jgi:hypothetical protein